MPNDPPKGAELKALEQAMLSVRKLDQLHYSKPHTTTMVIDAGHALDGVRVNGWARLINVLKVRDDIRQFRKESAKARAAAEKNDKVAEMELLKAERALSKFSKCPSCKGACGKVTPMSEEKQDRIGSVYYNGSDAERWQPCETCKGRGLVQA